MPGLVFMRSLLVSAAVLGIAMACGDARHGSPVALDAGDGAPPRDLRPIDSAVDATTDGAARRECHFDDECAPGTHCADGTCATGCFPGGCGPDAECGDDGTCRATGCADDLDCPEGAFCGSDAVCVPGCRHDANDCPMGQLCDQNRICIPDVGCAGPEVCGNAFDEDCDGTLDDPDVCQGECPSGAPCDTGTPGRCASGHVACDGEAIGPGRCAPDLEPAGTESCDGIDEDCDGETDEDFGLLGLPCGTTLGACAADGRWACSPSGRDVVCDAPAIVPTDERCNGVDDDCDGEVDEDWPALGTPCETGEGLCAGTALWICDEGGDTAFCPALAGAPGVEACNGLDDDCDGAIDNGFAGAGEPCAMGEGACRRTGVGICSEDGATVHCSAGPGTPAREICNGLDDDCDAAIDEDDAGRPLVVSCYGGTDGTRGVGACRAGLAMCRDGALGACDGAVLPAAEVCNGTDDDCDAAIDEDEAGAPLTQVCYGGPAGTAATGACHEGMQTCLFAAFSACEGEVRPSVERCDGSDDDCDGVVDDSLDCRCNPGETRVCYGGPAGTQDVGVCHAGSQLCRAGGDGFDACVGEVRPDGEVCDGRDNDCDGTTDEDVGADRPCVGGLGECRASGTTRCDAGAASLLCDAVPSAPAPERCNGRDDDCDGATDEDFGVGDACTRGTGACERAGTIVCNAQGAPACDAAPGQPVAERCNGADDNCDGHVDEDFRTGEDCGSGTGGCARFGVRICIDGATAGCGAVPGRPVGERCDGVDNDCDGQTDEGFGLGAACVRGQGMCAEAGDVVCAPNGGATCSVPGGVGHEELCNGLDDDCDGRVDEDVLVDRFCDTGLAGMCRRGHFRCLEGRQQCVGDTPPGAEACNGADDDCDGETDEGFGRVVCGQAACRHEVQSCVDGFRNPCDALEGALPERCDTLDNDCDGLVDDRPLDAGGACHQGLGVCERSALVVCVDGELVCPAEAGAAQVEICNDLDDDCDGLTDETGACPDVTPPSVTLTAAPLDVVAGEVVTIELLARDNRPDLQVVLTAAASAGGPAKVVPVAFDGPRGRGEFRPQTAGEHILRAVATDAAGNSAEAFAVVSAVLGAARAVITVVPGRVARGDDHRTVVTLDARSSVGGDLTSLWSLGDARLAGGRLTDPQVQITVSGLQDATVTLRVENVLGAATGTARVRVNRPPIARMAAPGAVRPGQAVTLDATPSHDGDADALTARWTLLEVPPGARAALSDPAAMRPLLRPDVGGLYRLRLVVSDGLEESEPVEGALFVDDPADRDPPEIIVAVEPPAVQIGQAATITIVARDPSAPVRVVATLDAVPLVLVGGRATFTPRAAGRFEIRALATDRAGNTGDFTTALYAFAGQPEDLPPTAALTAPADGTLVGLPFVVRGTADDAHLAFWALEVQKRGGDRWTRLLEGTGPIRDSAFGELDPSVLSAGFYTLRLLVEDTSGNWATDGAVIEVDPAFAFGASRYRFRDVDFPLAGVPIVVHRDYDSGRASPLPFGVGWDLDVGAGRIEVSHPPGQAWTWMGNCIRGAVFRPDVGHTVTVYLGDQGHRFYFNPEFSGCGQGFVAAVPRFTPFPGTRGRLEPVGGGTLLLVHGDFINEDAETGVPWDPQAYDLFLDDGRVIRLDRDLGVRSLSDGHGNGITIDETGIHHTSGAAVTMERDADGRIVRIELPTGAARTYTYDGRGDLVETVDFRGNSTRYVYGTEHDLRQIVDARGAVPLSLEYDETGRLVAIVDAAGQRTSIDHDGAAREEVVTDRLGNSTVLRYDTGGRLVEQIDALGGRTRMGYDPDGNLQERTDPLGHTTRFEHDADGRTTALVDATGRRWTTTYDAGGRPLTSTEPSGAVTTSTYDAAGRQTSLRGPAGDLWRQRYDDHGLPVESTQPDGTHASMTWSAEGWLTRYTGTDGVTAALTHDAAGNVLDEVRPRITAAGVTDMTWRYRYDVSGQLVGVENPAGGEVEMAVDALGEIELATDADGRQTRLFRDGLGRIAAGETDGGPAIQSTFDALDRTVGVVMPDGHRVSRTYDALGRPLSVSDETGPRASFEYDAAGRLASVTNADGRRTTYTHDEAGRPLSVEGQGAGRWSYVYDAGGRIAGYTDPLGARWTYGYDARGDVVSLSSPQGVTVRRTLDPARRPLTITRPSGGVHRFEWDPQGQLVRAFDPAGAALVIERNSDGQPERVTDGEGRRTQLVFDLEGNQRRQTTPLGHTLTTAREADGRQVVVGFDGARTETHFDSAGRPALVIYADDSFQAWSWNEEGRILALSTDEHTLSVTYAEAGVATVTDGAGVELGYGEGDTGGCELVASDAGALAHLPDAAGRLGRIADVGSGAEIVFTRDALGHATRIDFPDGRAIRRAYDTDGKVTAVELLERGGQVSARQATTYDAAGRATAVEEATGARVQYAYDTLDRLVGDRLAGGSEVTYAYDRVGNRVERSEGGVRRGARHDADDRLLDDGIWRYEWDDAGLPLRRTGQGRTETFTFDAQARLVRVERPGVLPARIEYDYDADGLLLRRSADGAVSQYVWERACNGLPMLWEVRDAQGALVRRFVRAPEGLVATISADGTLRPVLAGAHGSVVALVGPAGPQTFAYDGFGQPRGARPGLEAGFNGELTDPDLGWQFLRTRWYDPAAGRFLQPDRVTPRLTRPGALNTYAYAEGDPVNLIDPLGTDVSLSGIATTLAITGVLSALAYPLMTSVMGTILPKLGFNHIDFKRQTAEIFSPISGNTAGIVTASASMDIWHFHRRLDAEAVPASLALLMTFGVGVQVDTPSLDFFTSVSPVGSVGFGGTGLAFDTYDMEGAAGWGMSVGVGGTLIKSFRTTRGILPWVLETSGGGSIGWNMGTTKIPGTGTVVRGHSYNAGAAFEIGARKFVPTRLDLKFSLMVQYAVGLLQFAGGRANLVDTTGELRETILDAMSWWGM